MLLFFLFKQKTAYEMRISDWSSDVCSSDLEALADHFHRVGAVVLGGEADRAPRGLGRTGIGGHHQDHVAEVRLAPVGVGEDAAIHDLQQDVEDVRVRLLHLVEQQHAVRRLDKSEEHTSELQSLMRISYA